MQLSIRFIQICMVASIALFFTLVAFDNVIDYNSNWQFIQHVLSMDTTFKEPILMHRAIINPDTQRFIYHLVIAWEGLTAMVCWLGCLILFLKINKNDYEFHQAKMIALLGLFCGFLLYMVGFMDIAGEWFSMWQSSSSNGQMKAGLFISLIMFVMLFLRANE